MITSRTKARLCHGFLNHWIWVLAFLLAAAALTFFQADAYPPTVDEFASLLTAGLIQEENPQRNFLQALITYNISHMPGFYFALSIWGALTADSIAVARFLGILLYLLSLSLVYRLARDFIAPVAGLFALVIVMSNAFFNFYIAHARPYTLFLFLSCLTIWLYLRITHRHTEPTVWDLVSQGAAVFALVMTHLFSATLLMALGLYHLFFVAKNRRWLSVGLVITLAVLCSLPMVSYVFTRYDTAISHLDGAPLNATGAIAAWLTLMLNNLPAPLLLVIITGVVLGLKRRLIRRWNWLWLPALFLISLGLLGAVTALLRAQAMRHQVDGWILLVLFAAAGHYALYRWKWWLGGLTLLWIVTGLVFQPATNWWNHVGYRAVVFTQPPFHTLSRLAKEAQPKPVVTGYPYDDFLTYALSHRGHAGGRYEISPSEHYFAKHGVEINASRDLEEFVQFVSPLALRSSSLWYFHPSTAGSEQLVAASQVLRNFNYRHCESAQLGANTILDQYMWDVLECLPPSNPTIHQTDVIEYELFRVGLSRDNNAVVFVGRWKSRRKFESSSYSMSFQLVDEGRRNVAQLDLPLVAENELRQYSIDISGVSTGKYRLMLILYDRISGARLVWNGNNASVPEMSQLGGITIGESR